MFRKSGCWHIDYPITFFHLLRAQILESSFLAWLVCSCIPQSICKCIHLHFKTCMLVATFSISYAGAIMVCCLSHQSSPEKTFCFHPVIYSSHSHIANPLRAESTQAIFQQSWDCSTSHSEWNSGSLKQPLGSVRLRLLPLISSSNTAPALLQPQHLTALVWAWKHAFTFWLFRS